MSLQDYLLNSKASEILFETLELSHSDFSETLYFVRNSVSDLVATDEDSNERTFVHLPMEINQASVEEDLVYAFEVVLGDLGEILPAELELVKAADGLDEEPVLIYRAFRQSDLTAPLVGPITLGIKSFTFSKEGSVFRAEASRDNVTSTGVAYSIENFWPLRAFAI